MESLALEIPHEAVAGPVVDSVVSTKTLRTLIIPYDGGQAVLPNNLVVEVLPYAPSLGLENAPSWVIGSMLWKALPLPLVSLEFLAAGDPAPEHGTHNRIIVVQAVNELPKLRYYGIVGSEAPRMVELQRDDITREIFLDSPRTVIASQVLVQGQRAIVPNVDEIETVLSRVVTAARSM